nr:LCP family protein [Leucobacter exalbidus]
MPIIPGEEPAPKRRRGLRRFLIVLASIIAVLAIIAGVVFALIASSFGDIKRVSLEQDPSLKRPTSSIGTNILLLGSDATEATDVSLEGSDLTGNRSDSIMVAQIAPNGGSVTVMSIMRDNWVEIQGHGEAKINAAMSLGGLPLAVNTVENFIGARIDHVAMVDFESFKGLTDALGGVTVTNDQAFTTSDGQFTFEPGDITLSGEQALGFVRERYAFSDGDYQRARNQQTYLKGLTRGILSADTLTSPGKIVSTFDALKPYLVLDDGFDTPTLVSLGLQSRNVRGDDITFFTSPTLGTGTSPDGQSIVLPNWDELALVQEAFATGTLDEYVVNVQPGAEVPQG